VAGARGSRRPSGCRSHCPVLSSTNMSKTSSPRASRNPKRAGARRPGRLVWLAVGCVLAPPARGRVVGHPSIPWAPRWRFPRRVVEAPWGLPLHQPARALPPSLCRCGTRLPDQRARDCARTATTPTRSPGCAAHRCCCLA
jgi:hypothetical protein